MVYHWLQVVLALRTDRVGFSWSHTCSFNHVVRPGKLTCNPLFMQGCLWRPKQSLTERKRSSESKNGTNTNQSYKRFRQHNCALCILELCSAELNQSPTTSSSSIDQYHLITSTSPKHRQSLLVFDQEEVSAKMGEGPRIPRPTYNFEEQLK